LKQRHHEPLSHIAIRKAGFGQHPDQQMKMISHDSNKLTLTSI